MNGRDHRTNGLPDRFVREEALAELIAPVRSALQLDGADLKFEYERSGTAYFRLILTDETACTDCVMPPEILEQAVLTNLRQARPDVTTVKIDDPRNADT